MGLILTDFAKENSISGIWKICESEKNLLEICNLTDYDKKLLQEIKSTQRRIEILAVRALLNSLNPEITIEYNDRKPICNKGYISISHTNNYAAVIWNPQKRTTIDIEEIDERIKRIAKRALNETELKFANNNIETLTLIWSCKECIYKIANIKGLDFKKQIFVADFVDNQSVTCILKTDTVDKSFSLNKKVLFGQSLVWGVF
jgi:phosphopantetheinyl transferase